MNDWEMGTRTSTPAREKSCLHNAKYSSFAVPGCALLVCTASSHVFTILLQCLIEKGGYKYLDVRPTLELEEVRAAVVW